MTTAVVSTTTTSTTTTAAAVALCTAADPYPAYARLAGEQPIAHDPGTDTWIAAGAAEVRALLADPTARVRPPDTPVPAGVADGPAGAVFARLARMTDGEAHATARAPLAPALDAVEQTEPGEPETTAARLTRDRLRGSDIGLLTDLQHDVPVRTVAALLGIGSVAGGPVRHADAEQSDPARPSPAGPPRPDPAATDAGGAPDPAGATDTTHLDAAVRAVGEFVRCIPPTAGPDDHAAATAGARHLTAAVRDALTTPRTPLAWALAGGPGPDAVRVANAIGLLNQTLDATAGLVGNTLLALRREGRGTGGTHRFVAEVARHDPPIHNTRRVTTEPVRLGDTVVPAGAAVLVLLAAANRDPRAVADAAAFRPGRTDPVCFTYGAGAHHCPGRDWSVRIAAAVVEQVLDARPTVLRDLPDAPAYRPLGNARIPVLDRAGAP